MTCLMNLCHKGCICKRCNSGKNVLGRMDNWKKGDDYMLEKKGNGGEFEWKIMVEPHL